LISIQDGKKNAKIQIQCETQWLKESFNKNNEKLIVWFPHECKEEKPKSVVNINYNWHGQKSHNYEVVVVVEKE